MLDILIRKSFMDKMDQCFTKDSFHTYGVIKDFHNGHSTSMHAGS